MLSPLSEIFANWFLYLCMPWYWFGFLNWWSWIFKESFIIEKVLLNCPRLLTPGNRDVFPSLPGPFLSDMTPGNYRTVCLSSGQEEFAGLWPELNLDCALLALPPDFFYHWFIFWVVSGCGREGGGSSRPTGPSWATQWEIALFHTLILPS